jgi:UDP-GlcNAc:undecaprenyl-phosphate GlcNAc-1-phosphate transferase
VSYAVTPLFIRLAEKTRFLDYPAGRKAHAKPMPYLGGAAIFVCFWVIFRAGLPFLYALHAETGFFSNHSMDILSRTGEVFIGALFIFLLGLADDRWSLAPWMKLLGQAIAAGILMHSGLTVNLFFAFGVLGHVITFVWLLLIMNAFNFIDSIDGHCAGIAFISLFVFFCISMIVYQPVLGFFVSVLGGVLAGFLPYNLKPARTFLGDNGSLFLGYMMSAITLLCSYRSSASAPGLTPFVPILMFGVPIYDTVSVICVRLLRGIAPWKGDRNHFAHRLSRLGMSDKVAAMFSFFIALTLGLVAILSTQITTDLGNTLLFLLFVSIIGVVGFLEYYAAIRIRTMEELAQLKKRRKEDIQAAEERKKF